jgi:hypothetical protein
MDFGTVFAEGAMKATALHLQAKGIQADAEVVVTRLREVLREELPGVLAEAKTLMESAMSHSESFLRHWMNVQCNAIAAKAIARL